MLDCTREARLDCTREACKPKLHDWLNGTPTMVRPFPTYSSRRLPPSVTREADRDR